MVTRPGTEALLRQAIAQLPVGDGGGPGCAPGSTGEELAAATQRAADRLRRLGASVERYEGALDRVSEGVVICDAEGVEVYCNQPARRYMTAKVAGPLATNAVLDHLAAARRDGPTERLLELFLPVRRILLIRAFPLAGADGPIGAVAVVEDVSERRRVDAIRRDFVANVSHELKTPVGALSLLAETLDGEEDPEVIARLASRVSTEAERLGLLIDDLLDLSRIEANEAPTWEDVPVATVVGQSVEAVRRLAEAGGIALDVEAVDADLCVHGDRWELVSAVTNLVDNAVKYSEAGSRVAVTAREAPEPATGAASVEISVADRGIGIPKRELERIFERFYRVDRARSRSTGGTGLGLSIVRHVAANHGGTVRVVSEEGIGSTFTLSLPHHPPGEEEPGA